MSFRLETMCIRRMVPATMLRWNSGCHETSTTAARSSSFLMYEVPLRIFYVQLLFFWNQNPHVVGSSHRWQPISFPCQKHLRSLQLACADQNHYELHSVGMDDTRTDLLRHCRSWDTPHQCSQFSKMTLYPSIELRLLIVLTKNHVTIRIILLQLMQ